MQAISAYPSVPDEGTSSPPEEALQSALIKLGRGMRAAYRTDPAAVGVVYHLATTGPMRVSALAEALVLDISTASRHVSSLEVEGMLTREPDPDDRRATIVTLTASGHEFLARAMSERATKLRTATGSWRQEDIAELIRLINKLAEDITKDPS